jgi:hypothetical protein
MLLFEREICGKDRQLLELVDILHLPTMAVGSLYFFLSLFCGGGRG